jgi:transposase
MAVVTKLAVAADDRAQLTTWVRAATSRRSLAERARIILLSAEGLSAAAIAERLGVVRLTVYKWRQRYVRHGVSGLRDRPRPGQPRRLSPEQARDILRWTVERIPYEATHWSLRLMAKHARVSQWHVAQVWKAADLRPHRLKTFKISRDPQFAEKVSDVVGLYMDPPDNAVVLSVDEKTQMQALDRTQPMLPLRPGQIARRTHDYTRHGTASLYAAFDVATGKVLGSVTRQHCAADFVQFLEKIDRAVPRRRALHLVLDNSSTHKTPEVGAWLAGHPRFTLHFTPTSASWLNAVEGWFAQLERRAVRRGSFTSVNELRSELRRFITAHNKYAAKPFVWTKPADVILNSVARAARAMRINSAGH